MSEGMELKREETREMLRSAAGAMSDAEMDAALEENVRLGLMEHCGVRDGQQLYRMTLKGMATVETRYPELKREPDA